MTIPVTVETASNVPFGQRVAARIAVCAAWPLIRLSPRRLRRVLRALSRGARPATADQALAARRAVVAVSVLCAGQGCLWRSVATVLLSRMRGTWPDWCAGVRTEPFRAHAWVEVDGVPVGEHAEVGSFHPVLSVPAPDRGRPG